MRRLRKALRLAPERYAFVAMWSMLLFLLICMAKSKQAKRHAGLKRRWAGNCMISPRRGIVPDQTTSIPIKQQDADLAGLS